MYVIYPADELINLLIAREYSSTPTNNPTTTPYPRTLSRQQSLNSTTSTATYSPPSTPPLFLRNSFNFNQGPVNQYLQYQTETEDQYEQQQQQQQEAQNSTPNPNFKPTSEPIPIPIPTPTPTIHRSTILSSYHLQTYNNNNSASRSSSISNTKTNFTFTCTSSPYNTNTADTVPSSSSYSNPKVSTSKSSVTVATPPLQADERKSKLSFFHKLKHFRSKSRSQTPPPTRIFATSTFNNNNNNTSTNSLLVQGQGQGQGQGQDRKCPTSQNPTATAATSWSAPIKPERRSKSQSSKTSKSKETNNPVKISNSNLNSYLETPPTPSSIRAGFSLTNLFRRDKVYTVEGFAGTGTGTGTGTGSRTGTGTGTGNNSLDSKGRTKHKDKLKQHQQEGNLILNLNPNPNSRPRGRSATPSIIVTPTVTFAECEDETFTNYRGKNTSGGQRLCLISSENLPGSPGGGVSSQGEGGGSGSGSGKQTNITNSPKSSSKFIFPAPGNFTAGAKEIENSLQTTVRSTAGRHSSSSTSVSKNNISSAQFSGSGGGGGGAGGVGGQSGMIASSSTLSGGSSGNSGGNIMADPNSLKDLVHPSLNETLKSHNALTFKLIRIVSDFTQQLSQLHEQHAVELQLMVDSFRKRNADLRKERPPCSSSLFQVWETLLQEVEIDSQAHSDLSGSLGRQVARPLLEKTFCRKIQSRKIFAHRESFETVLNKTEALLSTTYRDYCDACLAHIQQGNSTTLAGYFDAHNAYVQQLRGTNAMLKEYHQETLPALLQELDEIYIDLCNTLSESTLHGADLISSRSQDTNRRYETLSNVCRNMSGNQDLRDLVKSMTVPAPPNQRHAFTQPVPLIPSADGSELALSDKSHVPVLKDEIIMDRLSAPAARSRLELLRKEMTELESQMKQLQDSLDTLIRMQQRSLDSNLFNKANELQEEISMKRFDLRVAQMHLAALRAQTRADNSIKGDGSGDPGSGSGGGGGGSNWDRTGVSGGTVGGVNSSGSSSQQEKYIRERKMSVNSNATMKSKWMKAFRSLKTPQTPSPSKEEKKNGKDKDKGQQGEGFQIFENHIFQEYTYKKITPCDICSQVLRGHTKQGLRCRLCKLNIHLDCQEKVSKCLPKTRLLRRQRSTSELETKLTQMANEQTTSGAEDESSRTGGGGDSGVGGSSTLSSSGRTGTTQDQEPDLIYQVLKQATDIKKTGGGGGAGGSSSGSGSGNGIHGSSNTLYSQHDINMGAGMSSSSANARRSNPSVNIVGQPGSGGGGGSGSGGPSTSGSTTPGAMGAAQALANTSSSSGRGLFLTTDARRDSYISHKSISAEPGPTSPFFLLAPPATRSRCISLPESPQTPHSPRRRKLDLRMKSFSLDSPESTEHAQRRRYAHGSHSTSHSQSPSSPVHNRRALLSARNVRMSSVELPDENDKSLSSASTSPCPSPKPHRLLPTNLYVVLYMFKARHPDELDLKAGYKVTVTDTTDPDWWQGKCMGRIGYFPSKYVTKLQPGEKPLQVTHNLQVTDGAENGLKLLRDQIVIQVGEELDGMVTIRNGDNKQGICPLKYLQEV